ncbi:MAG: bifunctional 3-deoxy-7-phosphoheptulonate synthase/chorismate mutase type II [Bacteroidia bacterium]|nr:bifunctional 3-deoxy-7-phosphoheptulonate synthase/chorismate mutase type II [Bacteroidia bacterium]MDW8333309.1 bifunctional 3-deoxy-7-phosphoheptulonate synthase/chorismate mutase type II [Bacteroidia bacterium]
MAGPCSAESEEQLLECARKLASKIHYFRAGVWKPRTRPSDFEGVGEKALPWLERVKKETGLRTATEVANAKHVEACLRSGVDALWIGARTTVSPFAVEEIAQALRGCRICVWVKNPVNPDLALWLGAVERLERVGLRPWVVHRGFSVYHKGPYRNPPQWQLALEFRRLRPDVAMLCDPSHICGRRELISAVAQHALDLQMDGLMVEVHPRPEQALSDPAQQMTPEAFAAMLEILTFRRPRPDSYEFDAAIGECRKHIDRIDDELTHLLAERLKIIEQVAELKRRHAVTAFQLERWDELIQKRTAQAAALNLEVEFLTEIYKLIHEAALERQSRLMNNETVAR